MWLRSQDKDALVNVNDICIYEVKKGSKTFYQFRCYEYGIYYILGEYSTKEEALQIMDIIQERIRMSEMFKLHIFEPLNRTDQFVFQIPKDSDDVLEHLENDKVPEFLNKKMNLKE